MNDSALLSIVVPVFCFIGLGYAIIRFGILGDRVGDAMADFVFTIAVPLHLFRAIGTLELPDIDPWPYWLSYFGGVAVEIALAIFIIRRVFHRDARVGVIAGMCASYSNIVMVGLPVVAQAFGPPGTVTVFLLIAIHLPVMMTTSAVMIEIAEVRDGNRSGVDIIGALKRVGKNLATNPFIIAILGGSLLRFSGLPLTGVPQTVIERVGDTAIPLALMALGMSLNKYGIKGAVLPAIAMSVLKLAVMPVVVFVLADWVFGLPPLAVAVAVISAACPTGANAYLIANRFQTGLALSANTITLTTAASVITMGFWLSILLD